MEITQQVRDHAAAQGLDEQAAVEAGLTAKSDTFLETGSEIYS